jgi:pimeloyl-ACP methyl ester carboxylesterase
MKWLRFLSAIVILGGLALIAVGASGIASAAQSRQSSPIERPEHFAPKPTVVLVHGAWADSSSWDGVIERLQHDGYPVVAFPTPLQGLASDSSVLADFLQTISGPIVLVGHSYGGAVITNAATGNSNVKALVYVDAFAPAQGQTVEQLEEARPGSCLSGGGDPTKVFDFVPNPTLPSGDYDLYARIAPDGPYPGFAACFANDLPASEAAVLAATQRPLSSGAISEQSGTPAWATIPSWYVVGTEDHVIVPAEQIAMAKAIHARITRIPASHLAMVSHPQAITDVIIAAAKATCEQAVHA